MPAQRTHRRPTLILAGLSGYDYGPVKPGISESVESGVGVRPSARVDQHWPREMAYCLHYAGHTLFCISTLGRPVREFWTQRRRPAQDELTSGLDEEFREGLHVCLGCRSGHQDRSKAVSSRLEIARAVADEPPRASESLVETRHPNSRPCALRQQRTGGCTRGRRHQREHRRARRTQLPETQRWRAAAQSGCARTVERASSIEPTVEGKSLTGVRRSKRVVDVLGVVPPDRSRDSRSARSRSSNRSGRADLGSRAGRRATCRCPSADKRGGSRPEAQPSQHALPRAARGSCTRRGRYRRTRRDLRDAGRYGRRSAAAGRVSVSGLALGFEPGGRPRFNLEDSEGVGQRARGQPNTRARPHFLRGPGRRRRNR